MFLVRLHTVLKTPVATLSPFDQKQKGHYR